MPFKIINFCPTDTLTTKENSLAPIFVNEVVEEVLMAAEIGITLVHLHARDYEEKNTYCKEVYSKIIEGIKAHNNDLVIGVSLSGRYFHDKYLRTEVLSLKPDMASLTMSSLNFPLGASINEPDVILWIIEEMNKHGVKPEIECFDVGMINYTNYLISKEILPKNVYINIILGNLFNAGADLQSFVAMQNLLPQSAKVCVGGIGKVQLKANLLGLLEMDGVRVGLEDNLYLKNKELATNMQLLKRIHELMLVLDLKLLNSKSFKNLGYANNK